MKKSEIKKAFPYLTNVEIDIAVKYNEYKTERGFLNYLAKKNEANEAKATKGDVKELRIDIEWKPSRMWGYNPHAEYWCEYADGHTEYGKATCSGCGYDKASTVLAEIFNKTCCGMLWRKRNSRKDAPYGIYHAGKNKDKNGWPYFEGGIGVECYGRIAAFLGGTFRRVASGKTFDVYVAEFKVKK